MSIIQEFFSRKNDASLFVFGSHSKKRPHNLILGKEAVVQWITSCSVHVGRLFDHHVLDMAELGVLKFVSWTQFKAGGCVLGSKPCLLFTGDCFETDFNYIRLKNLLIGKCLDRGVMNVLYFVLLHQTFFMEKKYLKFDYKV